MVSSAIVSRLHRTWSGRVTSSRDTPSEPLYRFHTAEVGGSSPLAPTRVLDLHVCNSDRNGVRTVRYDGFYGIHGSDYPRGPLVRGTVPGLSLIHISEPTRLGMISYAVF